MACWKLCGVVPSLLPLLPRRAGVGFLATSSWMMEVTQPWDCHPAGLSMEHGQGRAVSQRELWLVGGSEMCACRRRWHRVGRAVTVPVLLDGQEVGAGRLLARSSAFLVLSWQLPECPRDPRSGCCTRAAPRCSYRAAWRGVESSFGALGGSPGVCLHCTRCPARVCVLGTEQALCRDGQQCRATCVLSGLLPRACGTSISGGRRWMQLLWEAQTGLCGLLDGSVAEL